MRTINVDAGLDFYRSPGSLTRLPSRSSLMKGLPEDPDGLCQVSKNVIVHEFLAPHYGVQDAAARAEELENRSAAEMLSTIRRFSSRPLASDRPPAQRMIGNCRHFSVLTTALLRRAGIPARARAGFAGYFEDGWVDHWVIERWDEGRGWRTIDSQLDEIQSEIFGIDFDPMDMPPGRFLNGSQAWVRCRNGEDDPNLFGIMEMRGLWFVASNVVRDLAALNKIELLPWDTWGVMSIDNVRFDLIDEVAAAVLDGTQEKLNRLFKIAGLRVPNVVRSERFQRDIRLAI